MAEEYDVEETVERPVKPLLDRAPPPIVDYASRLPPTPPQSPTAPLLGSWVLIGSSMLLLLSALVGGKLFAAPFLGVAFSVLALFWACLALWRRRAARRCPAMRCPAKWYIWGALATSLMAGVVHGRLISYFDANADYYLKSTRGASTNLVLLKSFIELYYDHHRVIPGTLQELIDEGPVFTQWNLIAHNDTVRIQRACAGSGPVDYSYAYCPGLFPIQRDAGIVVAFEESPWTLKDVSYFRKLGHSVLFADRQVRFVSQGDLKGVLERDRKRREGLGWPICDWSKMYP